MSDLHRMTAREQADAVRRREVSPVDLTRAALERIDARDADLGTFVTVAGDALEQARSAEAVAGRDDAPTFCGVPIGIKDLAETAGLRTTFSSKAYGDYVPNLDSAAVARIRRAGFVILGKTNTSEFGTVPCAESDLNGVCRNPWNLDRSPGGSSGGSAAAVAAGFCAVAHGTDGGGSVRIPASCCGLVGIKPSRGRVSSGPRLGESVHGLSTAGAIARTVADAAALIDVMSGYEVGDPYWAPPLERPLVAETGDDPPSLRIGVTWTAPNDAEVDPEVIDACRDAADLLASMGHHVEEAAPEWDDPDATSLFLVLWQTLTAYHRLDPSALEPLNQMLHEQAVQTSSRDYVQAVMALHAYCRRVVAFWSDHDLLLTPTVALAPPPVGWILEPDDPWMALARSSSFIPFTPTFNATGQPAVSLPMAISFHGTPIGIQLVGPPAGEAVLVRTAAQIERARPWAQNLPVEA